MKCIQPLLIFCLLLTCCAPVKPEKKTPEKPKVEDPKLIGIIASIPVDRRFVLIRSYGKWTIEPGQVLTTRGPDDRTANLRTTGEALGEFAAADLQSGTVEVGDAVYSQHLAKPTPPPISSEIEQPHEEPIPENVQKYN